MYLRSSSATVKNESTSNETIDNNGDIPTSSISTSSTETFATTLSACWNSNSGLSTSLSQPSTSENTSNSNPEQTKIQIRCHLCPAKWFLSSQDTSNSNIGLHNIFMNLCKRLEISTENVPRPSFCTLTKFPFCGNCRSLLEDLYKHQQIVNQHNLQIEEINDKLLKTVVDDEIWGGRSNLPGISSVAGAEAEQQKSFNLRVLLLEVYRKNLMKNHTQQTANNVIIQPSQFSVKNENLASFTASTEDENLMENDDGEDYEELASSFIHQSTAASCDGDADSDEDEQEIGFSGTEQRDDDENFAGPVDPLFVDATQCNDSINTSENAEAGLNRLIQYKVEAANASDGVDEDSDGTDSDEKEKLYELVKPKRRFFFDGVEIYKAIGARSKLVYFQCSLCNFMLPAERNNTSKVPPPSLKMKIHILLVHKGNIDVPEALRAPQYSCILCNIEFLYLSQLRKHNSQHHPLISFTCEICGKPFKEGSSKFNLLTHKFSHKNDEERKIAIANGEKGSSNCMLSTKRHMSLATGKGSHANEAKGRKMSMKTGRKVRAFSLVLQAPGQKTKKFKCQMCNRKFARNCNLARHNMCQHNSIVGTQDQPTPSTSNLDGLATRRGQSSVGGRTGTLVRAEPVRVTRSRMANYAIAGPSGSGANAL